MEHAKPQATTKLLSQASKNVSRNSLKPAQLKALFFQNYHDNGQHTAFTS